MPVKVSADAFIPGASPNVAIAALNTRSREEKQVVGLLALFVPIVVCFAFLLLR